MRESTIRPSASPVVKEIAKRRLSNSKLSKHPPVARPCISQENVIDKLVLRNEKAHSLNVPAFKRKDRILPDINEFKNPYRLAAKDHFFYNKIITRNPKQTYYDIGKLKTITDDVHGLYYKVVNGRPVRPNKNIVIYIRNIREKMLLKARTAYIRDQILKIETIYADTERNEYQEIYHFYKTTVENFRNFVEYSYKRAKYAFMKQQKVEEKLQAQRVELEQYTYEFVRLRNLVLPLTEKFEVLLKYKIFLDEAAPIWWKIKNRIELVGQSITFKSFFLDSDVFVSSSNSLENDENEYSYTKFESNEVFFDKPRVIITYYRKLLIYFKEPEDLVNIIEDMASSCYDYLKINIYNTTVMKPLSKYKNHFKSKLENEMKDGEREVQQYKNNTEFLDTREEYLKATFFKILNNELKSALASYDVLRLYVFVQYLNVKTLKTTPDSKDSLKDLMKQVEIKYEQLMLGLDSLDYDIVKKITAYYLQKDREMIQRAYDAQRILREWAVFEKSLRSSFDPPRYKYKRSLL